MTALSALPRPRLVFVAALAALIATSGVIADPASARKGPTHNRADDVFSQKIRKHHLHGIAMAQIALAKSADPAVRDLAARILAKQTAEVRRMRVLLRGSGASLNGPPVPAIRTLNEAQQLAELRARTGPDFDRVFLTYMQQHHFGGVDMAEIEIRAGQRRATRRLAIEIRATQLREAEEMERLLARP